MFWMGHTDVLLDFLTSDHRDKCRYLCDRIHSLKLSFLGSCVTETQRYGSVAVTSRCLNTSSCSLCFFFQASFSSLSTFYFILFFHTMSFFRGFSEFIQTLFMVYLCSSDVFRSSFESAAVLLQRLQWNLFSPTTFEFNYGAKLRRGAM